MAIGQFMPLGLAFFDPPGTFQKDTSGAWSLTVPNYGSFLRISLWGGGGGSGPTGGSNSGNTGGSTTCSTLSMNARGGEGGDNPTFARLSHGGVATGGNRENITGERGHVGGSSTTPFHPYGGAAHLGGGRDSGVPGGGGHGELQGSGSSYASGGGGGGGAYCLSEYGPGDLVPDSVLSGSVGGPGGGWWRNGAGGRVLIEWG